MKICAVDEEQFKTEKLLLAAGSDFCFISSFFVGDIPDLNEFTGQNWGNNGETEGACSK